MSKNGLLLCATLLLVALALHYPPRTKAQTESPIPKHIISNSKLTLTPTMTIIIACLVGSLIITALLSIFTTLYCMDRERRRVTLHSHGVFAPNYRRHRGCRHNHTSRGLDPSVIDTFPTIIYSEVKTDDVFLECAVCLSEFENTDTLRLLPICCHVFHIDCVDAWLSTHVTCPVCRFDLAPKSDDSFALPSYLPESEPESVNPVQVVDSVLDIRTTAESRNSTVRTSRKERIKIGGKEGSNLVPKPYRFALLSHEPQPELIDSVRIIDSVLDVQTAATEYRSNMARTSKNVRMGIWGNSERFTLRLPEEVRSRLVMESSSGYLSRTKSCVNFQRARSSRKGYRSGSGGISKLGFLAATPPRKAAVMGGAGEEVVATPKTVLKSVRVPLYRLIWGSESNKERVVSGL